MPLTRARKKKAQAEEQPPAEEPKPEKTEEQLRGPGEEELERVLEESKKDAPSHDEDEDMKRALELSMESLEEEEADFHRVLEQSKLESQSNLATPTASTSGVGGTESLGSSQRSLDEKEDIKRALELSKLSQDKERDDLQRVLEESKLDKNKSVSVSEESPSSLPAPEASNSSVNVIPSSASSYFTASSTENVDEFDQMAAGTSASLSERINSSSIVINSDEEEASSKPASASVIIDSGDDSVVLQQTGNSSVWIDSGEDTSIRETSRSGWLEVESGDTDDTEDGDFNASLHRGAGNFRRRRGRRDSDSDSAVH